MAQRKRNIEFAKPEEPSFLKKLKNQVGIKENLVTVETKKEKLSKKDLDYRDEEPVYVVEEDSGVTEEDLEKFQEKNKQEKEFQKDNENLEKRIIFKKPTKATVENTTDSSQIANYSGKPKPLTNLEILKNKYQDRIKTVKNSSLLSFDEDENDDDEEEED